MTRSDLIGVVEKAIQKLPDKRGRVAEVAAQIWKDYETELRGSGDLFFTWQYDMRWAAQKLRDNHRLTYTRIGGQSAWQLM